MALIVASPVGAQQQMHAHMAQQQKEANKKLAAQAASWP